MATADYRLTNDILRYRWLVLGLMIAAGIWCWFDVMPRGSINWLRIQEHRTDFTVYTEAGAAFFDGRDPYLVSNPRGWRYLYPPMFAIVISPLHHLPSTAQVGVWFAVSAIMLLGCYHEMRRSVALLLQRNAGGGMMPSRWLVFFGWAGLMAAMLPALNCLQRGQVEVLKIYLLLLGFRMTLSGQSMRAWWLAGVVLAASVVLKVTPALPVFCLIFYETMRAWFGRGEHVAWQRSASLAAGVGTGILLFTFLIPASILGWNANIRHLRTWFAGVATKALDVRTSDFGEDVRTVRNQSLDNAAYRFGNWFIGLAAGGPEDWLIDFPHDPKLKLPMDNAETGQMIMFGRIAALAALLAFVVRAAKIGQPIGQAATFGLACVATLVVCPVARGCYFVLYLPAAVFIPIWLSQLGRPRIACLIASVPAALVCLYYIFLPFSGRIGLLGLGTAAWFYASCTLLDRLAAQTRNAPVDGGHMGERDRSNRLRSFSRLTDDPSQLRDSMYRPAAAK